MGGFRDSMCSRDYQVNKKKKEGGGEGRGGRENGKFGESFFSLLP